MCMVMVMADTKSFRPGLLALPPTGMSLPLCSFGLSLPAARQEVRAPFGYGIPATLGTLHELDMAVDERPLLSRILLRRRVRRWCDVHLGKHLTHTKLPWLILKITMQLRHTIKEKMETMETTDTSRKMKMCNPTK